MAYEESIVSITLPAAAAMPNDQYKVVKLNATGKVVLAAAADATAIGILQNKPGGADQDATVTISGVSKVIQQANLTQGAIVGISGVDGLVANGGANSVGICIEDGGVLNAVASIRLTL